jgi:AraC family transcriptional regulator
MNFAEPEIVEAPARLLAGVSLSMSLADDRTPELFRTLMPQRKSIPDPVSGDLFLATQYEPRHFSKFDPAQKFTRWAAVEVAAGVSLPEGITVLHVPAGRYAVFTHRGSHLDTAIFQWIFGTWFPQSGLVPDDRPHLYVMGEKYRHGQPDSEEKLWIPVRGIR